MTSAVFTDRSRGYDFVKDEYDQRYTRTAGTIQNKTGGSIAAGAVGVGSPLNLNGTQWETLNVGSEASIDGFVVDSKLVPALANDAITPEKYQILIGGPGLINLDQIPVDPDGSTGVYDLAAIKTRCAALVPPLRTMREPATTQTQTT